MPWTAVMFQNSTESYARHILNLTTFKLLSKRCLEHPATPNKSLDASRDSVFRMKLCRLQLTLPRGRVNSYVGWDETPIQLVSCFVIRCYRQRALTMCQT